jgi:hypothetical protein
MQRFRGPTLEKPTTRKLTYDDILASLSMKVENGRLVITRNIVQEHERAGIPPPVMKQPTPLIQPQQPPPQQTNITPLEKLKQKLQEKQALNQKKKLFLPNDVKATNTTRMKMSIY